MAERDIGDLQPGESYSVQPSVRLPDELAGSYYLFVLTDLHGAVFAVFGLVTRGS